MCGIVGIIDRVNIDDKSWLQNGRDLIYHRGPDDCGLWWSKDDKVGFGHRRLSILDLSESGHQPMLDRREELVIVFNGEIYNHVDLRTQLIGYGHSFISKSDTEVILEGYRQWGKEILSKLVGMFAFALYDKNKNIVFIARDRAGEKPLFYYYDGKTLIFASELKGLLECPKIERVINREAMDCYLSMGFVPGDLSIFKGINKLQPAHYIEFNLNNSKINLNKYWELPEYESNNKGNSEILNELEGLLENAIKRQLVADVPVGVLLSGGVDSSLITAFAARSVEKLKTFTVCFSGNSEYDEKVHAKLIADYFNTEHIELEASNIDVEILYKLARQYDEPLIDSSMIPTYLVSKLVREHCTVALGGDGGDELFGGYGHYSRLIWLNKKLGWLPREIRGIVASIASNVLPIGFKGRNWLQALDTDFVSGLPLIASYYDRSSRKKLLSRFESWEFISEQKRMESIPRNPDLLQRATRSDFENYLVNDILVKVDRASMLNSLEIRAPFLDHNVIEYAFKNVPSRLKATIDNKKIILKQLSSKILPPEFDKTRKQGFSIPLGSWLQNGKWHNFFKEILLGSTNDIFNKKYIEKLLIGQTKGRSNSERLFSLLMFELWVNEYKVSI